MWGKVLNQVRRHPVIYLLITSRHWNTPGIHVINSLLIYFPTHLHENPGWIYAQKNSYIRFIVSLPGTFTCKYLNRMSPHSVNSIYCNCVSKPPNPGGMYEASVRFNLWKYWLSKF